MNKRFNKNNYLNDRSNGFYTKKKQNIIGVKPLANVSYNLTISSFSFCETPLLFSF